MEGSILILKKGKSGVETSRMGKNGAPWIRFAWVVDWLFHIADPAIIHPATRAFTTKRNLYAAVSTKIIPGVLL